MQKKPTHTLPVAICAAILAGGAILLAILMATREMAPPRKYEVDMSGGVIGIDTTTKIPVLTKEEAKEVEVKENKKVDYVEPEPQPQEPAEAAAPEPVIVPSTPPAATEDPKEPTVKVPQIEQIPTGN